MYLGFAEKKDTLLKNPLHNLQINEILINPLDFTFVSNRNIYLDSLLGYAFLSNDSTEHVLTEDLQNLQSDKPIGGKHIAKDFHKDGYAQHVCRLRCADGTLLYVLSKVFMHMNQFGEPILVTYSIPFAFSTDSQVSIDEGMRFITSNEIWLAIMPSFASNLMPGIMEKSVVHNSAEVMGHQS